MNYLRIKRGMAILLLVVLGTRAAIAVGDHPKFKEILENLSQEKALIAAGINLELGKDNTKPRETEAPLETSPGTSPAPSMPSFPSDVFIPLKSVPLETVLPTVLPTTIEGGMVISNDTSFEVDLHALVGQGPSMLLPKDGVQVLIIHTHSSEAYMPDITDSYTSTDKYRTEDTRFNIIRVGDELSACLESYGLNVIHDRGVYDYPSYTGSYTRSEAAVGAYLKEHPEIKLVIDVHRDAIGNADVVYKTFAENGGEPSSQIMLLAGTGENGLPHPNWQENLKLALYLQKAVVDKYPTLARPIALKKERYNQQLTIGSLILEVGSNGNSLQEALCATRLFADAIAPALLKLRNS